MTLPVALPPATAWSLNLSASASMVCLSILSVESITTKAGEKGKRERERERIVWVVFCDWWSEVQNGRGDKGPGQGGRERRVARAAR